MGNTGSGVTGAAVGVHGIQCSGDSWGSISKLNPSLLCLECLIYETFSASCVSTVSWVQVYGQTCEVYFRICTSHRYHSCRFDFVLVLLHSMKNLLSLDHSFTLLLFSQSLQCSTKCLAKALARKSSSPSP